jgi:hypothetical protein
VEVGLEEPEGLCEALAMAVEYVGGIGGRTSNAAVTDSSHKSNKNSSNAIDSLSTLIIKWHSCGRKNSISS